MNLFGLFSKPKAFLGVDIGTASVKIVELAAGENKPILQNYGSLVSGGYLEKSSGVIQTHSLKILEKETSSLLKFLLSEMKPKTRDAVASVPSFAAYITLLELPDMSPADTAKAMAVQPYQYIPLPVSEVAIDWWKVGERKSESGAVEQQILLTSVPNEHLRKLQTIFKNAGLKLRALEIESFSLARVLIGNDPTSTILIDIGAYYTNIAIVAKGLLRFNASSDYAGSSLTQAIAGSLNVNLRRAEEIKKQRGLTQLGGEYELSTLMQPFLDVIINEVRKANELYEKRYGVSSERIILSGGGAELLGIEKYFGDALGLPAVKGLPFARVAYPPKLEPAVKNLNSPFAIALGLGIRELS